MSDIKCNHVSHGSSGYEHRSCNRRAEYRIEWFGGKVTHVCRYHIGRARKVGAKVERLPIT